MPISFFQAFSSSDILTATSSSHILPNQTVPNFPLAFTSISCTENKDESMENRGIADSIWKQFIAQLLFA